jgi:pimeloyl-ACP methyl ester carboxylesterase
MPTIIANGLKLHYEEQGRGEHLILLMGLGADGAAWKDHVKAYAPHFHCIMVDNRGAGQSDKPEGPYSSKMMAEDTLGLMDALNIQKAHISGISMGSVIAQELALKDPDRVTSLTLNCPWSRVDAYAKRIFETLSASVSLLDQASFTRLLQLIIFTPQYHANRMDDLLAREQAGKDAPYPMPIHAFKAQCDACINHNTTGLLHRIKAPTLITVGDQDIFTPLHFSKSIHAEIKQAKLDVFAGSGHTHHWDNLDYFNTTTLNFMLSHTHSG